MKEQKEKLRKKILETRCALVETEVREKSAVIMDRVMKLELFEKSTLIMCYVNFRNEVLTKDFINRCLKLGKRVAVPLVECSQENGRVLKAREIKSLDEDLEKGHFGILEPKLSSTREVDPFEIDMVVIPGVVFGSNKHRIGYGAGYYDRFLPGLREDCFKVGVAFECQISKELPQEPHDVPLDRIITEERIL